MPDSSPDSRVPEREAPQPLQAPEALASDALVRSRITGLGSRAVVAFAVPIAAGLLYLAAEDAFEVHSSLAASVVAVAAIAIVGLFVVGLRDLRRAEARTAAAFDRARAAEENERRRADDLARILVASQSLRLAGDGRVDYMSLLAEITPAGATSFLVEARPDGGIVSAAHGPLAPMVLASRVESNPPVAGEREVRSFSAHGRTIGRPTAPSHLAGLAPLESGLAIPLVGNDDRQMGWLHMIDPADDRILERSFVALAQLVANQIAVAMQNDRLLANLRHQLAEVQRVQQQLVQASKLGAIGELAAAVAHEVNNPLTGILGFAELLMTELPPEDPRRSEVAIIREEAMRARSIIRELLDFARPHTPHRLPTDLNAIAASAVELIRYRAQETNIRVVERYSELPKLDLDPESFKQVLLNLCSNGIEAMHDGGELTISTLCQEGRVGVVVSDTGIGMDRKTRDRIFTPFFAARNRGGYGTGLGLSVSLNVVQGHGGVIDVESEVGKGSVFTVWLPIVSDRGQQTEEEFLASLGAIPVEGGPAEGQPIGRGAEVAA